MIPSCPVRRTSHGQKTGKEGTREGQGRDKEPDRNLTPYGHPTDKEPGTTDKELGTTDILRTHADMKEDTPGHFWDLIYDSLACCWCIYLT